MVLDEEKIIKAYNDGQSMTAIAKELGTYAITIKRILEKRKIRLRHDVKRAGTLFVKGGDELIEWAKSQGRPVTKKELAEHIGRTKLSPSYFEKYPELGQYVAIYEQKDLQDNLQKLYTWLQKNHIPYKPGDRTRLKVSVDALLLGDYSNTALQIAIKPSCVSVKRHSENMLSKKNRAHEAGMKIIFLYEKDFINLDELFDRIK